MKPHVLWIEDSARLELRNLTGPVLTSSKFDFDLAEDVTSAVNFLRSDAFDAVIVDVRLPPGVDSHWQKLYQKAGANKVSAQLGLKLLHWLFEKDHKIYPEDPPNSLTPQKIGIFTVESKQDISVDLSSLGIEIYEQKMAGLRDTILKELFEKILNRKIEEKQTL